MFFSYSSLRINSYFYTIYTSISKQTVSINQVITMNNNNITIINEISRTDNNFIETYDLQGLELTQISLTFAPFFLMDPFNLSNSASGLLTQLLVGI